MQNIILIWELKVYRRLSEGALLNAATYEGDKLPKKGPLHLTGARRRIMECP